MTHLTEAQIIAQQNDDFRQNFGSAIASDNPIQGKHTVTQGFLSLDPGDQLIATLKIRNYNDFTKDNDPYGEHDYGSFKLNGETICWKIDYYDLNYQYGSENPANPTQTRRVLTAMLSWEW
jgi:hypothetical protein